MEDLAGRSPEAERVAFTMHGPGYGLDEREAFESLIAGLLDADDSADVPRDLAEVVVVERNPGRARRLTEYLARLVPSAGEIGETTARAEVEDHLREVGYSSQAKPHVFVAMPFSEAMSDHYHYGIQGAVNSVGYLCERIDGVTFTGDVLERIKERISTARLVVADLSGGSANVYLEVGYAWGLGVPTVLLIDNANDLKFDVAGQHCLVYKSIHDLESKLTHELNLLS